MHNWRQFLGSQPRIEFAVDERAPMTLLLGPNGSGKTGLLNAFTWCLYEDFTPGFDEPDKLIHDLALARGGDPYVEVSASFNDDGDEFTVVRRKRPGETGSTVAVKRKPGPGRPRAGETLDASLNDVYNVLPKSLKDVFFFPAESLQTLSITDGTTGGGIDLRKAIESLLGFDPYISASANLRAAVGSEMLRMPPRLRDETIETARVRWEEAQEVVSRRKRRRSELPDVIAAAAVALSEAEEEERQNNQQAIEQWMRQRDALRGDREGAKVAAEEAAAVLNECFRDMEHVVYATSFVDDAVAALNRAERAGRIPPSISSDILDKILDDPAMPCVVCGREMDEAAHQHVKYLRGAVTDSNIAANALSVRSTLTAWGRNARTQALRLAQRLDLDTSDLGEGLSEVISRVIAEADNALIAAKARLAEAERALEEFEADQDEVDPDQGALARAKLRARQRTLHELETEAEQIDRLIEDAEGEESEAKLEYERKASRQDEYRQKQVVQTLLADTAGVFDRIADAMRRYGRTDFQRALNATYSRMINKPYVLEVADNFTVRATVNGRTRALSQSEKTALTLAFLGAVAGLAPQYRNLARKAELADMGNVRIGADAYPVVLDAPYSPFDETYAGTITTAIGDLGTQVVMTVSKAALKDLERIEHRVGKAYVLELKTSSDGGPEGIFENELVRWRGKDAPYVTIDESLKDAVTSVRVI
ncbi:AAA family ATPase [Geodermatophilus sabuli]|uniref:AAA family ATPase n=1 Tax=Geodermatophilus sabuli TaxID=1564158 RepID=UPI00117A5FEB|nr:AAA family ATPase [Geodermatophilus sabuli]MBB3084692.1 energy-coupling factor transporter ATP-binding protein EcfA2 [Geodermatophilus sabuli]